MNQTCSVHLHAISCFCFCLCKCSVFPLPGWLFLRSPVHGRIWSPHQPPSCRALPIHVFTEDLESLYPKSIFTGKWTDWSVGIRFPLWVQWTQGVDQHGSQISEKEAKEGSLRRGLGPGEPWLLLETHGFFLMVWCWCSSCYRFFLTPLSLVLLYPLLGQRIFWPTCKWISHWAS